MQTSAHLTLGEVKTALKAINPMLKCLTKDWYAFADERGFVPQRTLTPQQFDIFVDLLVTETGLRYLWEVHTELASRGNLLLDTTLNETWNYIAAEELLGFNETFWYKLANKIRNLPVETAWAEAARLRKSARTTADKIDANDPKLHTSPASYWQANSEENRLRRLDMYINQSESRRRIHQQRYEQWEQSPLRARALEAAAQKVAAEKMAEAQAWIPAMPGDDD